MKKNRMMRLASILLVCVLLTTSVISGTFAKYTTTGPVETDTARVAKWGVTITAATAKTTFSDVYVTTDTTLGAGITNSVDSADGDKVIAPGTEGTLAEVTIAGSPEVAVSVTYDAEVTLTGWTIDSNVYCPVIFTVNSTDIMIDATNDTIAKLEQAIEDAIEAKAATYGPNVNLTDETDEDVEVTWRWAFDNTKANCHPDQTDIKDTALGDTNESHSVTISITTTVTQID